MQRRAAINSDKQFLLTRWIQKERFSIAKEDVSKTEAPNSKIEIFL